ncbi:hypothetical protein GCM10007304_47210 [Rhodococcoides trifolii]|uniref:Uncharacterized protein n=1 Tax=Rhodococcoides trifolii TaxID=908250 RepID=A0A917G8I7_9NOCA|nr:polysaccharide biosynthesis tyrosine autokinase [Rhodococcus trifolii]GGG27928.1 hypothetical protein GCM10007304_47210 [Rhodococcus trifolii]
MNEVVRHYLFILRDRWRSVAVVALIVLGLVSAALLMQGKTYSSTSAVFVTTPRDDADTFYRGDAYARERAPSYVALVASQDLALKVIDDLGLDTDPATLIASIVAAPVPDTVLISLTVTWSTPELAQQINQAYITDIQQEVISLETVVGSLTPRAQLDVVEPPSYSSTPAGLSPILILGAATGVGLAAGAAFAVLLALRDRSVRTAREAEDASGVPVLTTLGADDQTDPAEPMRELRTALEATPLAPNKLARTVLIASSQRGDGKTSVALGLAEVLCDEGKRVAVIDLDARTSDFATRISEAPITVSALVEEEGVSTDAHVNAKGLLTPVPIGVVGDDPGRFVDSPVVTSLIHEFGADHDWIIIDTAASTHSDALRVSKSADTVVLVVAAGRSTFDAVGEMAEEFRQTGHEIAGVVFNATRTGRTPSDHRSATHKRGRTGLFAR